mgnify:FL=1|tara:strand:- start:1384 stop:2487 length:1104 start_codon:yes stop_codon:yes gene_type:complete
MATFEAQVEGLTGLSIDGSSAPTQTELTQFLTDGAKEILNALPRSRQEMFTTSNDLNSSSVNLTLLGSEVFSVTRDDGTINQPCRKIPAKLNGRVRDSDDMMAATATDPVYYIVNNILSVVPEPSNSNNAHVQTLAYPSVAYGDSAVAKFPDDGEYLIPIYASIKSLQNALSAKSGNSDITTALTAINTELDETQAICDELNTQVDAAVTQLAESATQVDSSVDTALAAITTAAGRINTAVGLANTQFDSAVTSNTAEDIELATSQVNAGNGFLSEASSSANEAQTYVNEVNARISQVGGYGQVVSGYINAAQGFANEIQTKLQISQGYGNEVNVRLNVDSTEYSWMEKQQAKLQSDYEKGLAQLVR